MRNIFFLLILSNLVVIAKAQYLIKEYVTKSTVSIQNINPDSTNYGDLDAIGKAIGDSRIVMIGEQDHGDATTLLAKTRLVKFLHEKKGFDVLAFESDFFGLNYGWDRLQKNEDSIKKFIQGNIFGVWTGCFACKDLLFQYIPNTFKTESPLILTGFDMQMFLVYSYQNLLQKFDSILFAYQLPITKRADYTDSIRPLLYSIYNTQTPGAKEKYDTRNLILTQILEQLKERIPQTDFWLKIAESFVALNSYYKVFNVDFIKRGNIRDEQMAKNLNWLCKYKFPGKKIIVWAANEHVSKYADTLNPVKQMRTMGSFFTGDAIFSKTTYVLGFTSYEGETGRVFSKETSIPKPKPNGFETWINKDFQYAFVDFKPYMSQMAVRPEEFYLKALGHNTAFKKDWTKVFDGIFFIREMSACHE